MVGSLPFQLVNVSSADSLTEQLIEAGITETFGRKAGGRYEISFN
jgi:hypothetical protein